MTTEQAAVLTYGHPVRLRMPGREPIAGHFVCLVNPPGVVGVSTVHGYDYFGVERVEIVAEPKFIRRR